MDLMNCVNRKFEEGRIYLRTLPNMRGHGYRPRSWVERKPCASFNRFLNQMQTTQIQSMHHSMLSSSTSLLSSTSPGRKEEHAVALRKHILAPAKLFNNQQVSKHQTIRPTYANCISRPGLIWPAFTILICNLSFMIHN